MHQRHHASPNENRRSAVVYVSTGLACLPRDIDAFATTAEERLYKRQRPPDWKSPKNKVSDCETAAGNCLDLDFDFLSSILL